MRHEERESLRRRFGFRCGYCGVAERDVGSELTVDHFQPRSRGGSDEPDNWVYCCHPCNEFKGAYWQPDSSRRILHPLRDPIETHVVEQEDGTLRASSETGSFATMTTDSSSAATAAPLSNAPTPGTTNSPNSPPAPRRWFRT